MMIATRSDAQDIHGFRWHNCPAPESGSGSSAVQKMRVRLPIARQPTAGHIAFGEIDHMD
jgi:hypothetical protein